MSRSRTVGFFLLPSSSPVDPSSSPLPALWVQDRPPLFLSVTFPSRTPFNCRFACRRVGPTSSPFLRPFSPRRDGVPPAVMSLFFFFVPFSLFTAPPVEAVRFSLFTFFSASRPAPPPARFTLIPRFPAGISIDVPPGSSPSPYTNRPVLLSHFSPPAPRLLKFVEAGPRRRSPPRPLGSAVISETSLSLHPLLRSPFASLPLLIDFGRPPDSPSSFRVF